MANPPSLAVQEAFIAPVSEIRRRIEIYESDGVTPWRSDLWDDILSGGSVTCNYGDAERRTFECTLDNTTAALNPDPEGGLWYDKVFKLFYGISLRQDSVGTPRVLIIEEEGLANEFINLKAMLSAAGIKTVHYNPLASLLGDLDGFDVIVSMASGVGTKLELLKEANRRGKAILTIGAEYTAGELPLLVGATGSVVANPSLPSGFTPDSNQSHPLVLGTQPWTLAKREKYNAIRSIPSGADSLVWRYDDGPGSSIAAISTAGIGGARWLHMTQTRYGLDAFVNSDIEHYNACMNFMGRAIDWLGNFESVDYWEMQIGEMLADSVEAATSSGDLIKVVGRDYTKRCLKSKFSKATTFTKDMSVEQVIRSVASNAGIIKFDLPATGKVLGKDMTYERDVERWKVMYEIAEAFNYEIYFTHDGFLTMREFRDPVTSAPTLVLRTGPRGNLVSRGAKTSDSELFNHITVVGESSDSSVPLVFGEAINNNPGSPTRVGTPGQPGGIGDRVKNISSAVVTDSRQAQELAEATLAVSSLEEFEMNFSSVLFPWIEPGEIVEMDEVDDKYWGPSRYLITSLSIPLDLNPMSGTGKRVTKV